MNGLLNKILAIIFVFILQIGFVEAGPYSLFWTNCTPGVYATGLGHLDADNYGTVFNRRGHGQNFPPDIGLTLGIFTWEDLSAEVGFDYLTGTDDPWFFNSKIAVKEDILFCNAPAMSLGIFGIGTRTHGLNRTNQNIIYMVFGKNLPNPIGGTFTCAGFSGNRIIGKNRQGFMAAYQRMFAPTKDCSGKDYNKWGIIIDYASGKNSIGGLGLCLNYFFNPECSIETGPVFFNDANLNGSWKYSMQVDIDFSVFDPKHTTFKSSGNECAPK